MNIVSMAKTAYTSNQSAPLRTERGTEYDVFAKVTHQIDRAANSEPKEFGKLATALHQNRKLWTLLASDVAEKENALPEELKARIFYLYEFTNAYSKQILKEDADPSVLVEINTAVMRGLRDMGAAA